MSLVRPAPPVTPWPLPSVRLGVVGEAPIYLEPNGQFSLTPHGIAVGDRARARETPSVLRHAAELAQDSPFNIFAGVAATSKRQVLTSLQMRLDDPATTRDGRASAFALLFNLADASHDALFANDVLAVATRAAARETDGSLSRFATLHIAERSPTLAPIDAASLHRLVENIAPSAPPYAEWFKGGNHTVRISHFAHKEFFDDVLAGYADFPKKEWLSHTVLRLEKTVLDPACGPPTTFVVDLTRVDDSATNDQMFKAMGDRNVQVVFYTGHSNLGGNIDDALKAGAPVMVGTKLVGLCCCIGTQNVADFSRKYGAAHLIATQTPATRSAMVAMVEGVVKMIAARATYADAKAYAVTISDDDGRMLFPHDLALAHYRDLDGDGRMDGNGDILFSPAPYGDARWLANQSLSAAVGFANTVFYYHDVHAHGASPINSAREMSPMRHLGLVANGYYDVDDGEFLHLEPAWVSGMRALRVTVNHRYASLGRGELSLRVLYELARASILANPGHRPLSREDQAFCLLLACEWLRYFCNADPTSNDTLFESLRDAYGWSQKLTWSEVDAALQQPGYASRLAVEEFLKRTDGQ